IVEELVIGRLPERIVHDDRPVQHRNLQPGTVKLNVLRDAVDDNGVFFGLIYADVVDLHEFCGDVVDLHRVDLLYHGRWEGVFYAKQNADLLHAYSVRSKIACSWMDRSSKLRLFKCLKNTSLPSSATTANHAWNCHSR